MKVKTRVLVIDDSAVMREILTQILNSDPELEVIGSAPDPYVAREKIKALNPDVLTLDVEMPRMDGIAFLRNLMRLRPMPVVMCSSLTQHGAAVTFEALALGAVDFVVKPRIDVVHGLKASAEELITKVKMAAGARLRPFIEAAQGHAVELGNAVVGLPKYTPLAGPACGNRIIAIGASTGGTEAIKHVLALLPGDMPGIVIVQHIPKAFSGPFAARLNANSALNVCEARDGQPVLAGHAYVAPGGRHLFVMRDGARYRCKLSDGEPMNRHRPSVDVLFRSVAASAGSDSIGILLTGMGRDGAEGMKEMREAGASTLAQDEDSSVVWGMPGAAWHLGAAQALCPLPLIARRIMELAALPQKLKISGPRPMVTEHNDHTVGAKAKS